MPRNLKTKAMSGSTNTAGIFAGLNRAVFDEANEQSYMERFKKGLSRELVEAISRDKNEPEWMLEHRLKSLELFLKMPLPQWGPDLSALNFDEICFFAKAADKKGGYNSWEEVPKAIKTTFDRLGIPEAERKVLAGTGAQYDSVNAYHKLKEEWESKGVIFEDMDMALKGYREQVAEKIKKLLDG